MKLSAQPLASKRTQTAAGGSLTTLRGTARRDGSACRWIRVGRGGRNGTLFLFLFLRGAACYSPRAILNRHLRRRIICLTLAFFPCLLLLSLVETWLSSPAPSSSSTFFSPIFHSGGDLALVTVEPTRMADSTATAVSRSGFDETGRLRERRRKSVEEDGRVV